MRVTNRVVEAYLNCKYKANLPLMATRAQWRRLVPRAIIGKTRN